MIRSTHDRSTKDLAALATLIEKLPPRKPLWISAAILLVGVHLVSLVLLSGRRSDGVAYLCVSLAGLCGATLCCFFWSRARGALRFRWGLFTGALFLRAYVMGVAGLDALGLLPDRYAMHTDIAAALCLAFLLLSLTAVYTAGSRLIRWTDITLALCFCVLRYRALAIPATGTAFLGFVLAGDIFLCITAWAARFAVVDTRERLFLRLAALYLGLRVITTFCGNQIGYLHFHQRFGSPWFAVGTVTELLFAIVVWATLLQPEQVWERVPERAILRGIMPFFLAAADVCVGVWIIHPLPRTGVAGILIAVFGYALRTFLMQRRSALQERTLLQRNYELERLLDHDVLTGVGNRRSFAAALDKFLILARLRKESLCLIMIDLDHFKSVNDSFGHPYGDQCLVSAAAAICDRLDTVEHHLARLGGDEFALLLPNTDRAAAKTIAELLREAIATLGLRSVPGTLTATLGVAIAAPNDGLPHDLVDRADRALYLAKTRGRNRVEVAAEPTPQALQPPQPIY